MSVHDKVAAAVAGLVMSTGFALAAPAIVETDLNVRAGPGTEYPIVGVLPAGATVDVGRCTGSWCLVAFGDGQGFASNTYLAFAGAAPVYGGAPVVGESYAYEYAPAPYAYYDDWPAYGPGVGVGVTLGGRFGDRDRFWPDRRRSGSANVEDMSPPSGSATVGRSAKRQPIDMGANASVGTDANVDITSGRGGGRSSGGSSVTTGAGGRAGANVQAPAAEQ